MRSMRVHAPGPLHRFESEGVQDEAGRPLAEALAGEGGQRDAHASAIDERRSRHRIQRALKSRFAQGADARHTLGYLRADISA